MNVHHIPIAVAGVRKLVGTAIAGCLVFTFTALFAFWVLVETLG